MKALIFISTILFSLLTFAQSNCEYSCSVQCKALAERILNNCGGTTNPPPTGERIEFYKSDSCSSDMVAAISSTSDCSRLVGLPRVWGIRMHGQCMDIDDMDADKACYLMKAAANPYAVALYRSDTCSDDLVAYVDSYTNCQALSQYSSSRIWGIKINGQCRDIADMDFIQACEQFKNRRLSFK